jgi:hypothetical protein
VYTVQSGNPACLPLASTSAITMKIDEPTKLDTCTALPIHITGGQKPYTVTLAAVAAWAAHNITLGRSDDTLEWVNTLAPSSQFIVAVSDRSVAQDLRHRDAIDSPTEIARVNMP